MRFLVFCLLLIPAVQLAAGWAMRYHAPKKINSWVGYRTERSMQNEELEICKSVLRQTLDAFRRSNAGCFCGILYQSAVCLKKDGGAPGSCCCQRTDRRTAADPVSGGACTQKEISKTRRRITWLKLICLFPEGRADSGDCL